MATDSLPTQDEPQPLADKEGVATGSTEPPGRRDIETVPPESWGLSIRGSSPLWADAAHVQKLQQHIMAIMHIARQELSFDLRILRHVLFSGMFRDDAARWQRELGHPEGTMRTPEGEAIGKTLTWGSGAAESSYSVIILNEGVAVGLLEPTPLAAAVLLHELGHVHDDAVWLHTAGPLTIPDERDWSGMRRYLARIMWGDFFAERPAARWLGDAEVESSVSMTADLLAGTLGRMSQALSRWRSDQDMGALWGGAVTAASDLLAQLGRCLGLLAHDANQGTATSLFEKLEMVGPGWGGIAREFGDALAQVRQPGPGALERLEDMVEWAFRALGLEPQSQPGGDLYIDVRDP